MKRYLLIAVLALTFSFAGVVAAEQGSGDDSAASTVSSVHQDGDREDQDDDTLDEQDEQEHLRIPPTPFLFNTRLVPEANDRLIPVPKRQEFNDATRQDRADLQEKRAAFKADIEKVKKEKASVRKNFVEARFTGAIANLHTLADRIEVKIDELTGKGYNLTDAGKALAAAKDSLGKAEADLAALKASVVSDTNDATVAKPRELAKQVETDLKAARDYFRDALQAIKTALNG